MATKVKIDRAAFPLLHKIPVKNVEYIHTYSTATTIEPREPSNAVAETMTETWLNVEGMEVLTATNYTVWTVSRAKIQEVYGTDESTAIPPPTGSTRYVTGWRILATSAEGTGTVSAGYSAIQRAIALESVEVLSFFQKNVTIDHSTNVYVTLSNPYVDPDTGEPLYTRYPVGYYHCIWTVEVWERNESGEWIMHTETRDNYIQATANNWFYRAVKLDKIAYDKQVHDDITEKID